MALDQAYIGTWRDPDVTRIANSHGTRPVRVAKAGTAGSRFHAATASNSPATANTVRFLRGRRRSVASGGGFALTTTSITRTAGSFITDGYKIDDRVILSGATTRTNDTETIVTAVAALTLTVTAASFTAEAFPDGAEIYVATQDFLATIAASAGFAAGTLPLNLMDPALNPSLDASPNRVIILGPNGALFVALGLATAAASFVEVAVQGGDY